MPGRVKGPYDQGLLLQAPNDYVPALRRVCADSVAHMRRFPFFVTVASLIAATFLAFSSAPSNADNATYDVWGIRGADRVISSDACRRLAITASTNISRSDFWEATTEVYLRGEYIESVDLSYESAGRLRGYFWYCPGYNYVGEFKVGPTEVSVWPDEADYKTVFMDSSKGSFKAKQAARFTKMKASRKDRTVTIKTNPQYYSVGDDSGWYPGNAANHSKASRKQTAFRLQRRGANGTGSWQTIKTARPPKGKTLTFKVKAKKKAQYRIVSNETRYTFAKTSKVVKR